ncbi:hypothetical protein POTOM_055009 [Populus tomentosa]|uniref:Binding partner of ACD11 1-like n=2 Tax=Populus TaxID=3689 RepID=A0A8X7XZS5_POPTO|nr:hypothetical protein POTOM_055009 [Populus tomentosa]
MYPGGYTAEVTSLSPKAEEKDVYEFFSHCGAIEHVEIIRNLCISRDESKGVDRLVLNAIPLFLGLFFSCLAAFGSGTSIISGEYACTAYVTFKDAYGLQTAILLSASFCSHFCQEKYFQLNDPITIMNTYLGATIVDQRVCITHWGTFVDEFDAWGSSSKDEGNTSSAGIPFNQFVSTPGEAVTVAQEVVKTMLSKGYILGKDAMVKAKAFDESHQVLATAAAKVSELSNRIGLTDKIYAGMETVKGVDEKYHVSEFTKSAASVTGTAAVSAATFTGKTAVAAANAVVNSTYFAKGALWVSGVLTQAAEAAADLGKKAST